MENGDMIWAYLVHLGTNMWADREVPEWKGVDRNITAKPELRFNDQVWNRMVDRMVEAGINMVVIDLGDVSGNIPAVLNDFGGQIWLIEITLHDIRTANQ